MHRPVFCTEAALSAGSNELSRWLPPAALPPGAAHLREEHALAAFVDTEGRSVKGGDKFNRFLAELVARVKSLVLSSDPHERLAGVLAIDELASTKVFSQSAARLGELVKLAMEAFQATTEAHTMQAAAATLGRIVKAGGALMADVVEEQVGGRLVAAGAVRELMRASLCCLPAPRRSAQNPVGKDVESCAERVTKHRSKGHVASSTACR